MLMRLGQVLAVGIKFRSLMVLIKLASDGLQQEDNLSRWFILALTMA